MHADTRAQRGLESLASLKALAARWPHAARGDPARWMAELFEAAENGHSPARQVVEETAALLGIAVANLSVVVDPSLVVLGGALIAQGEPLVHKLRAMVERIAPSAPQIVVSALGKEAPLWGSLLVAATEARQRLRLRLREARRAG